MKYGELSLQINYTPVKYMTLIILMSPLSPYLYHSEYKTFIILISSVVPDFDHNNITCSF